MKKNPFGDIEEFLDRMSAELPVGAITIRVDLVERDDEYLLTADLPGFDREHIDISLRDRDLSISAERDAEATESDTEGRYIRREREHRGISRTIRLPELVEAEGVEASLENGVLSVTLPKREVDDSHQIEVS